MWKINELCRINIVRKINKRNGKIYLFLDFDGVINILGNLEDLENEEEYDFCDAKAVKRISDLCLNFDIDIIISSSWRFSGLDFCREYLVQHGLDEKVRVSDVTQSVSLMSREEDILQYLYEHEDYKAFLILDDIAMNKLKNYAVLTNEIDGYSEEKDSYARSILSKQL